MVSFSTELAADYRSQLLEEVPSYFDFAKSMILPEGKSRGRAMIVPDDAPEPNHPAQLCILAALDEGFEHVSIVKPVRDGGTQVSLVPLFRRAIKERQRALLCYPTMTHPRIAGAPRFNRPSMPTAARRSCRGVARRVALLAW